MRVKLINDRFPNLNIDWFKEHSARDPEKAFLQFNTWLSKRQERKPLDPENEEDHHAFLVEVLAAATGKVEQTARFYLLGKEHDCNVKRNLALTTLRNMDHIAIELGVEVPYWPRKQSARGTPGVQVAILSELEPSAIPSLRYHMRVIHGIVHSDSEHLFLTALHEVRKSELTIAIEKILRVFSPAAFVLIRLTPSRETIDMLKKEEVPLLLIHADRRKGNYYSSPPVLINIVPDQGHITRDLKKWIREHHSLEDSTKKEIVVVSMKTEGSKGSIRDERIKKILNALKPLPRQHKHVCVDGYSFEHAYAAYDKNRDAALFVCLSDQLAVAIKHLLMASGKDYEGRVIGFDNSELSKKEQITSFDQGIERVGREISSKLSDFFANKPEHDNKWPHFEEKKIPVRLPEQKHDK